MLGSLFRLSSSSKKTRSGLMTLSFWNQAGNTSFLSKFCLELTRELPMIIDANNDVTSPAPSDTARYLPLKESLVETRLLRTGTFWRA